MPYIPDARIDTKITDAVGAGLDSLSRRQRELAHRAYALLLDDDADDFAEDGGRS